MACAFSGTSVLLWTSCLTTFALLKFGASQQLQAGGSGWALRFDGEDDLVVLDQKLPEDVWTIEMWVKPFSLVDGAGIDVVTYRSTGVLLSQTSMTSGMSPLTILHNGAKVWIPPLEEGAYSTPEVDPEVSSGQLFHYAAVKDSQNLTVYINGENAGHVETMEASEISPYSLSPLVLGARYERSASSWLTTDSNFGGVIDELRFWEVALSVDEINYYMNRTVPSATPGLFEQWRFDEGLGDAVLGSYWLGGGDTVACPKWVPSPVVKHGGPVAISGRIGQRLTTDLCALLTPAVTGAEARVTSLGGSALGTLSLESEVLGATSAGSSEESARFCTSVSFQAASAGFENVAFTVTVTSPSGSFEDTQNVSLAITNNTPPSAGQATAIQLNGEDEYLSLGSWDPGESFTISFWVDPIRFDVDSTYLSIHEADGSDLFRFGPTAGGYTLQNFCRTGCATVAASSMAAPLETGSEVVLNTGLTADEVQATQATAHHLTLTWECLTRGNVSTGEGARSHIKVYQDGLLIRDNTEFATCLNSPLLPELYAAGDLTRPTPWVVGAEYDEGGTLDEFPENIAGVPSHFMQATFDDFMVWTWVLSEEEVASVATGGRPHAEDVLVRFTFDSDDSEDCQERQLWDTALICQSLNEEQGRISPPDLYSWTMAPISSATTLNSPFYQLRGSSIHRSMVAGTCENITLTGSDADGDGLTYSLGDTYPGVDLSLWGNQLRYCDNDSSRAEMAEVEIRFDACDSFGACASQASGLASAIFHVLPAGPKILAFQAVHEDLVAHNCLRLLFDGVTSCPTFLESSDVTNVMQFSSTSIVAYAAYWEPGCTALRIYILDTVTFEALVQASTTAEILLEGGLRNEDESSFPIVGTSPVLATVNCTSSEVLLPGELACEPCPDGYIPGMDALGYDACRPCSVGTAGIGSCVSCNVGTFSNETGSTECRKCPTGHSCPEVGMDTAQACPEGYYQEFAGSSSCDRCAKGSYAESAGSSACTSCLPGTDTEGTGYTSASDCKCPEGHYRTSTDHLCVECGRGTVCQGFGAEPQAAAGYMLYSVASDHLEIFSCLETDRCPGGLVGACADGREGISCAECVAGRRPGARGTCTECSGADSLLSVAVLVVTLIILAFTYFRVRGYDSIRLKHETALAMMTIVQLLLVLQLSSVLNRLAVDWPEPLKQVLDFLVVFNFDFDILRVGCVKSLTDFDKYIGKLAIIPAIVVALSLCHLVHVLFREEDLRTGLMRLAGAIGIFISGLYVSLTSAIAAPLQCSQHPNGRWTMVSAEAVLCWEGGDHTVMLILGCLFLLIPLGFFGWMVYLMKEFPVRMSQLDVAFLNSFSFLFARVRPEARWFMIFVMARNGLVALVPALPNSFWQCAALISIFNLSSGVTLVVWPWKLYAANVFDIATSSIFQALGCLALPFVTDSERSAIPEVGIALVLFCLLITPMMLVHWLIIRAIRKGKAYRWFLCHQKASAGSFARLLKLSLTETYKAKVFLDSDDLVDLNKLFHYVKHDVQTLTVLCTKEVIRSPWCLGEISVATLSGVEVLPLYWPDFGAVEDAFVENVNVHVSLEKLTETGLSVQDVQNGLRHLVSRPAALTLPDLCNEASLSSLVKSMVNIDKDNSATRKVSHGSSFAQHLKSHFGVSSASASVGTGTHAVLVDLRDQEAVSAGLILLKLLRPHIDGSTIQPFVAGLDSVVHGQSMQLPPTVVAALLLCTTGCFSSPAFLQVLVITILHKVPHVLPAAASTDFSFPTPAFYQDLESAIKDLCVDAGVPPDGTLLTPFVKSIFQKIFMHFFVQDSMTILNTQAHIIHGRLTKLNRADGELTHSLLAGQLETLNAICSNAVVGRTTTQAADESDFGKSLLSI